MRQEEALKLLKSKKNVFLTGPAGSGKTFVLNQFIDYLKKKGEVVAITATTGLAATHLNGITIHSWSGLGLKKEFKEEYWKDLRKKKYLHDNFKYVSVLLIDEISMLSASQLDAINELAKRFKNNSNPFGGLQVVLSGDLFQLSPIHAKNDFIFKSKIWKDANFKIAYLTEQFRQKDKIYFNLLNDIRYSNITTDTLKLLKSRINKRLDSRIKVSKLFTHNKNVDELNERELKKLKGKSRIYELKSKGNSFLIDILKKSSNIKEKLKLKIGASVIFTKNNLDEFYVNGTLAEIRDFSELGFPIVETADGNIIEVKPVKWTLENVQGEKAEIEQLPLNLAWALTIHKSQGMSLDLAEIDLRKTFIEGMGYVALSRVKSLSGLSLKGFNRLALKVNAEILKYDQILQEESKSILF